MLCAIRFFSFVRFFFSCVSVEEKKKKKVNNTDDEDKLLIIKKVKLRKLDKLKKSFTIKKSSIICCSYGVVDEEMNRSIKIKIERKEEQQRNNIKR